MVRVPHTFNPSARSFPSNEADRELLNSDLAPGAHRFGALRGLLIAGGLSAPVWIALYLLLR